MDNFEYNLLKWLPISAKAYYKDNKSVKSIRYKLTDLNQLKLKVRKIMFENGKRFVRRKCQSGLNSGLLTKKQPKQQKNRNQIDNYGLCTRIVLCQTLTGKQTAKSNN